MVVTHTRFDTVYHHTRDIVLFPPLPDLWHCPGVSYVTIGVYQFRKTPRTIGFLFWVVDGYSVDTFARGGVDYIVLFLVCCRVCGFVVFDCSARSNVLC